MPAARADRRHHGRRAAGELVDVGSDCSSRRSPRRSPSGSATRTPQQGEPTYAPEFTAADFEIDWAVPVVDIHRLIRVGGAWTTFRSKRLKIVAADLVDGRIVPTLVQPEGRPAMSFDAWRNGARPGPTDCSAPCDAIGRRGSSARGRQVGGAHADARQVALEVLRRIEDDGAYANLVLGPALQHSGLGDLDRKFVDRAGLRHDPHAPGVRLRSSIASSPRRPMP